MRVKQQGISGKKVAEIAWASVLAVAASGTVHAASHKSWRDTDDLTNKAAEEKSGMASVMMAGSGVEAASDIDLSGDVPADIAQLIQSAVDADAYPELGSTQEQANSGLPQAAGETGSDAPFFSAMMGAGDASGSVEYSEMNSTIDWNNAIYLAQAPTGGGATPGIAGGGDAVAAAPMGFDTGLLALLGVGAVAVAAGSGGGGGGSSTAPAPTPTVVTHVSGTVVDGYVAGADVFVDANGDGIASDDEKVGFTDAQGNFQMTGSFTPGARVFVQGGVNNGVGDGNARMTPMNVELQGVIDADGQIVVSPLTTLLATSGLSQTDLKTALGIPQDVDLLSYDPIESLSGSDPSTAEGVFAAAQQVMTLLQTAVASGVSFETATQTLGAALSNGGDLHSATQSIVSAIGQENPDFAGASAQTQLLNSIENLNSQIAQSYSGLSEALGDPEAMAQALAPTTVAQTDFLDAVGSGEGFAQFANDNQLQAFIDAAESDIVNNVQTLDAGVLANLLANGINLGGEHVTVTLNGEDDVTALANLLTTLNQQGGTVDGLLIDNSLSGFQESIVESLSNAGVPASIPMGYGEY